MLGSHIDSIPNTGPCRRFHCRTNQILLEGQITRRRKKCRSRVQVTWDTLWALPLCQCRLFGMWASQSTDLTFWTCCKLHLFSTVAEGIYRINQKEKKVKNAKGDISKAMFYGKQQEYLWKWFQTIWNLVLESNSSCSMPGVWEFSCGPFSVLQ